MNIIIEDKDYRNKPMELSFRKCVPSIGDTIFIWGNYRRVCEVKWNDLLTEVTVTVE